MLRRRPGDAPTTPIRWVDERRPGLRVDPPRPADRRARSSCAASSRRPTRRLWRILGLLRRGVPEAIDRARRPGSRRGSSPRWAATSALEAEVAAAGARLADPADARGGDAPRHGQAGGLRRPRAGRRWPARRRGRRSGPRGSRSGLAPGLRDGRHLRRGVRGRDAVLLLDLRGGRVGARGAAGRRGPRRSSSARGPVRIGQGIEFDYCAVQAADTLRASRLERGDDQLEPGDRLDRLRRLDRGSTSSRSTRRACGASSTPRSPATGGRTRTPPGGRRSSAARRRSTSPRRWPPAASRCSASTSRRSTRPRSGPASRRSSTGSASRSPRAGWRTRVEEALTLAERIGYPVIVRPSFVIGGLAIDFCYSPADLARQLAAATVVDPDRPVRIDRYLEGVEVDVDAVSDGAAGAHPGPPRARRAGRRPLGRLGRRCSRPRRSRDGDQDAHRRDDGAGRPRARRPRPGQRPVHRPRRRRLPHRGQPARLADRAVPVQGDRRADGRAGGPDLARRDARRSSAGPAGCSPPPPFVAVKAPAFSTAKLRGVDPSVGPGMQSTGEVIGIADGSAGRARQGAARRRARPAPAGCGGRAGAALDRRPRQGDAAAAGAGARGSRLPVRGDAPARPAALAAAGFDGRPVAKLGAATDGAARRGPILDAHRVRRGPARRQHADAALGRGPRRGRDPPGGDRRGHPLPDRDRDRGRGGRGARPRDRRPAVRGPLARRVGAGGEAGGDAGLRRQPPGDSSPGAARSRRVAACPRRVRDRRSARRRYDDRPGRATRGSSVVRPTMTTASGTWRRRSSRPCMPGGASAARHDVAAPRPEHVAADHGRELDGPAPARPAATAAVGVKNAVPRRSAPFWSGSEIAMMIRWPSISRYVR